MLWAGVLEWAFTSDNSGPAGNPLGPYMKQALIFLNGAPLSTRRMRTLGKNPSLILAADGGANLCHKLRTTPSLIIGDLDSISRSALNWARNHGVPVRRYPRNKDATDLELAARAALDAGCDEIALIAATGRRLDQELENLMLGLSPAMSKVRYAVMTERGGAVWMRGPCSERIMGRKGDVVSLLPFSHTVKGVRTTGLHWPLTNENLSLGKGRTLSNRLSASQALVEVASGILLLTYEARKPGCVVYAMRAPPRGHRLAR